MHYRFHLTQTFVLLCSSTLWSIWFLQTFKQPYQEIYRIFSWNVHSICGVCSVVNVCICLLLLAFFLLLLLFLILIQLICLYIYRNMACIPFLCCVFTSSFCRILILSRFWCLYFTWTRSEHHKTDTETMMLKPSGCSSAHKTSALEGQLDVIGFHDFALFSHLIHPITYDRSSSLANNYVIQSKR